MTFLLLILMAAVIAVSMVTAYSRSRDPLHPLMFLGPMCLYVYVFRPCALLRNGKLNEFLNDNQILFAQYMFTLGITLLCVGSLLGSRGVHRRVQFRATPVVQQRLFYISCLLGTLSLLAYWFGIFKSGGFFVVYSHAKGHYSAGSGWVNELVNLSIPAAALMLLAWQGQRRNWHWPMLAVVFASPLLIHGIMGARRGPTFIAFGTLLVAWYLTSKRRPALWKLLTGVSSIGLLLIFLVSHRQHIHIGSSFAVDWGAFTSRLFVEDVASSDDTVVKYGFVNGVEHVGRHYWGLRYGVTYFVRPIPRQLWPTKYEDLGLGWMVHQNDYAGISDAEWREELEWVPVKGSAPGFIEDLYLEFAWAGLLGCLLIGWFFGWIWSRACRSGGLWTLLFVQALALSVYVPTQSVSAIFHRFLFTAFPTIVLWMIVLGSARLSRPDRRIKALVRSMRRNDDRAVRLVTKY
jgi:oligosaccharide repeat unit polymerase